LKNHRILQIKFKKRGGKTMLTRLYFDTNRLIGGGVEVLLLGKTETFDETFCLDLRDALLEGKAQLTVDRATERMSFIYESVSINFQIKAEDFPVVNQMINHGNIQIENRCLYVGDDHCGGIVIVANG
jgi:hypothetical protein